MKKNTGTAILVLLVPVVLLALWLSLKDGHFLRGQPKQFQSLLAKNKVSLFCFVGPYGLGLEGEIKFKGVTYTYPSYNGILDQDDSITHLFYVSDGKQNWARLSRSAYQELKTKYLSDTKAPCREMSN